MHYFINYADGSPNQSRTVTPVDDQNELAAYKAHRYSNLSTATASSGSQKHYAFDATLNRGVMVYESQGKIYYITQTGSGGWSGEVYIGEGKNPSVDAKRSVMSICYLASNGVNTAVKLKLYRWNNTQYTPIFDNNGAGNFVSTSANAGSGFTVPALPLQEANPIVVLNKRTSPLSPLLITFDASLEVSPGVFQTGVVCSYGIEQLGVPATGFVLRQPFAISASLVSNQSKTLYRNPSADVISSPLSPFGLVWQSYPAGTGNPPIWYAESSFTSSNLVDFVFSIPADQTYQTVNYQFPTIAISSNGEKHIAWQAHNTWYNLSVAIYERITSTNSTTPLTQLQLGYSNHYKPSINWVSNSATILAESGSTSFAISKPDGQSFGSFSTLAGRSPNIVASSSKRYCTTTGSSAPYQIQFGEISAGGGGSAEEQTASGGGKGNAGVASTQSLGGETPASFQLAERVTGRLSLEQASGGASSFLELTLADVILNGNKKTGLTYRHLGANLLADTLALTPQTLFNRLKSRAFTIADSISQISAVVKVRSENLYGLTQNAAAQLAVELFNAETGVSIALSETILVSEADTAKEFHFTMNPPNAARGAKAELRVKVLGFTPQASHRASALNTITMLAGDGGAAMLQSSASVRKQIGSVPKEFGLSQNYPNPFNPATVIRYQLPAASAVKLSVFDVLGREIATLVNEKKDAGIYEVPFNAANYASGTYFYRLQAGAMVQTKKMMLVK